LPVPVAPTIAISGLAEAPKLAETGVWQRGQARIPVTPPHFGQAAWAGETGSRPVGGNAGRLSARLPVSRSRSSSRAAAQPGRPGDPRPVHWYHSRRPSTRW
jgi:hypothetical protein